MRAKPISRKRMIARQNAQRNKHIAINKKQYEERKENSGLFGLSGEKVDAHKLNTFSPVALVLMIVRIGCLAYAVLAQVVRPMDMKSFCTFTLIMEMCFGIVITLVWIIVLPLGLYSEKPTAARISVALEFIALLYLLGLFIFYQTL